jgi:hypothetical protein
MGRADTSNIEMPFAGIPSMRLMIASAHEVTGLP